MLYLKIRDRENVFFQGEIKSLSSTNAKGKFDVLQGHANFITLVRETLIVRPKEGEERVFDVKNGVMRVLQGRIEIFLGMGS